MNWELENPNVYTLDIQNPSPKDPYLEVHGVVISMVVSPLIWVRTTVTLLITLLIVVTSYKYGYKSPNMRSGRAGLVAAILPRGLWLVRV